MPAANVLFEIMQEAKSKQYQELVEQAARVDLEPLLQACRKQAEFGKDHYVAEDLSEAERMRLHQEGFRVRQVQQHLGEDGVRVSYQIKWDHAWPAEPK